MKEYSVARLARIVEDKVYIGGMEYPLASVIKFDNFKGIATDDAGNRYAVLGGGDIEQEGAKLDEVLSKVTSLAENYKQLTVALNNLAKSMDFQTVMINLFFGNPKVFNFTVNNSLTYEKLHGYAKHLIIHNTGSADALITFAGSGNNAFYTIPSGNVNGNPLIISNVRKGEVDKLWLRSSGSSTTVEVIAVMWEED